MSKLDLLVISRFKNARLYDEICSLGGVSAVGMSTGINVNYIYQLINLRLSPCYKRTGSFTRVAQALSDYLNISADELFPEALYQLRLPKSVERRYESHQVLSLIEARSHKLLPSAPTPEDVIISSEFATAVREALATLPDNAREVIELRFGLNGPKMTLDEVAQRRRLSKTRIMHLEAKGLRLLRNPKHARSLRNFINER